MTAYELRSYPGGAAETTLASGITNASLSIPAVSAAGYSDGTSGPAYIVIDYDNSKAEKIRYTSLVGNSFVVPASGGRAQDGTSAVAHSAGAKIRAVWTATDAAESNAAAHHTVGQVTAKGDLLAGTGPNALAKVAAGANNSLLVADSTQAAGVKWSTSLTSPTITTPTITGATVNGGLTATNPTSGTSVLTTVTGGTTGVVVQPGAAASLGMIVQGLASQVGALLRAKLGTSQTGRFIECVDTSNVTLFAVEADGSTTLSATSTIGGVSGATLAAERAAWTTYTPTFGNVTGATGTFAYLLVGKTLTVRARFTAGTVTATGPITVSLPASLTSVSGPVQPAQGAPNSWQVNSAATVFSTGALATGTNIAQDFFFAVIEVA